MAFSIVNPIKVGVLGILRRRSTIMSLKGCFSNDWTIGKWVLRFTCDVRPAKRPQFLKFLNLSTSLKSRLSIQKLALTTDSDIIFS